MYILYIGTNVLKIFFIYLFYFYYYFFLNVKIQNILFKLYYSTINKLIDGLNSLKVILAAQTYYFFYFLEHSINSIKYKNIYTNRMIMLRYNSSLFYTIV